MASQYYLNELSLEGQFEGDCVRLIEREIAILSDLHQLLLKHGIAFNLNRGILKQNVGENQSVVDVIGQIEEGLARFFWNWIGAWPFHQSVEEAYGAKVYSDDTEVSKSGIAHAAIEYWLDDSVIHRLFSLEASKRFSDKNIHFKIRIETDENSVILTNAHSRNEVEIQSQLPFTIPRNWKSGLNYFLEKYKYISFTADLIKRLNQSPWNQNFFGLVDGKIARLNAIAGTVVQLNLARSKNDTSKVSELTEEYNELYQNMFVHKNSTFCDESDSNKRDFKSDLTFQISENYPAEFCPFHTKFDYKTSRMHFTWPMNDMATCIHIVYLGRKITI